MYIKKAPAARYFIKYLICWLNILTITFMLSGCWQGYVRSGSDQGFYYIIKKGDTLYSIAQENHVDHSYLAEINGLKDSDVLKEGTVLFIPGAGSINDARQNGQLDNKIKETNRGPVKNSSSTKNQNVGKEVAVAKGYKTKIEENHRQAPAVERKKVETKTDESNIVKSGQNTGEAKAKSAWNENEDSEKTTPEGSTRNNNDVRNKGLFVWPVKGKVISHYGRQTNGMFYNGIRIEKEKESAVDAAGSGHVIFSAFLKDYGETIIIKHSDNYATVYTHLSKRLVRVDQRINKGDKIAVITPGNNGTAYFDFEIRYKNKAKDPLLFL